MNSESFKTGLQIAKVLKSDGTDGGMLWGFRNVLPEDLTLTEPVFIHFDGLPVPFFISEIRPKSNGKAVVHLAGVNCLRDSEELAGRAVFSEEFEEEEDIQGYVRLKGWTLKGFGCITDFMDIPSNPCIEVETAKGKMLVPLHEDLVRSLDKENRILEMTVPEGLADLIS